MQVRSFPSGYDGRYHPESISLTGSFPELPHGIRIGRTSERELRGVLGYPFSGEESGDTVVLVFSGPSGADEYLRFHFLQGLLREVSWEFYRAVAQKAPPVRARVLQAG